MANNPLDTTLLDKAIIFAVKAHSGTERRGKGFPYIVHPMEAMEIVSTMTADQELLAAAALHDTVEDTDVTVDLIRNEFGDRVADLVAAESDKVVEGVSEEDSWKSRKQAGIDLLAKAPRDVKMVALGDKLSNMRAIARDYEIIGDKIWNLFHAKEKSDHEWRYRSLLEAFRSLEGTSAFKEFEYLVNKVFGEK
ncbi:MAG: bifunctional (p)ppGpp synthetase/guanosine-3',5'-bis(diphosphate) 3'-pyrophosphohydrolase [Bacteroidales bacterium]|nr:bifunctional (p)ppGpp synthetase/guanosine-3',5'-bis(diphosphate) 3'-pyrophosphohydrolase [Bacteroidales bacterium]